MSKVRYSTLSGYASLDEGQINDASIFAVL